MSRNLLVYPYLEESAAENMATDLWCFFEHSRSMLPAFRNYGWNSSCATFGFGQSYEWVSAETGIPDEKLCRRPTGGGIVEHGKDWTYSLVIPATFLNPRQTIAQLYQQVHGDMSAAFIASGIETKLLACSGSQASSKSRRAIPGKCFLEPVPKDVVLAADGKKIAGAAIKKTRAGILFQGTVDRLGLPEDMDWVRFQDHFLSGIADSIESGLQPASWPDELESARRSLVRKFASDDWLHHRRSIPS